MSKESRAENRPVEEEKFLDPVELEMARGVMSSILKAVKSTKMYLANNPMRSRFQNECFNKLSEFLTIYYEFSFIVNDYELIYENAIIYENSYKMDSFSFKLYVDGIRQITFSSGISNKEVELFLTIVGKDIEAIKSDDDIGTMFWNAGFSKIAYIQDDGFFKCETEDLLDPSIDKGVVDITALLNEELKGVGIKERDFLPLITEEEIEQIRNELYQEEKNDPIDTLIAVFSSILLSDSENDSESIIETMDLLQGIYRDLLRQHDFKHLCMVLSLLDELQKDGCDELKELAKKMVKKAAGKEMLGFLGESLLKAEEEDGEEVVEGMSTMLSYLPDNCVRPLTEMLCILENMKQRRIICDVLIEKGKSNSKPLFDKLSDKRWYVLRNILYIIARIGGEEVNARVKKLIKHEDVRVRKEVLRLLETSSDHNQSNDLLADMIFDNSISIRIGAIRLVGQRKNKKAIKEIKEYVQTSEFREKESSEKEEMVFALLLSEGENVLPMLHNLLNKKKMFGLFADVDSGLAHAVIKAIVKVKEDYTASFIDEVKSSRNKVIKEVCSSIFKV